MSLTKKYNPFRPNYPAPPGMFSGRYTEISRINDLYMQLKNNNASNLLILGERGIGKSSLLLFANFLATGKIDWDDNKYNYLCLQFNLNEKITEIDLIKKINLGLEKELAKEEKEIVFFKKIWGFI